MRARTNTARRLQPNALRDISADAARRRRRYALADELAARCTELPPSPLWRRWSERRRGLARRSRTPTRVDLKSPDRTGGRPRQTGKRLATGTRVLIGGFIAGDGGPRCASRLQIWLTVDDLDPLRERPREAQQCMSETRVPCGHGGAKAKPGPARRRWQDSSMVSTTTISWLTQADYARHRECPNRR